MLAFSVGFSHSLGQKQTFAIYKDPGAGPGSHYQVNVSLYAYVAWR